MIAQNSVNWKYNNKDSCFIWEKIKNKEEGIYKMEGNNKDGEIPKSQRKCGVYTSQSKGRNHVQE